MPRRVLAAIAFICCTIIWGSTFAICKMALQEFRPLQLVVARFALGALALSPLALRHLGTLIAHWKTLTLLGLVGITVPYAVQNWALQLTSATAAGLIMASIPAMTSVFSVVILRESVGPRRWAGIFISITGVFLLVLAGAADSGGAGTLAGNVLQVACAASWGLYTVLSKREISAGVPDSAVSAGSVIAGLILCIPFALVEMAYEGWKSPSVVGVLQVVYLGLFASSGTFVLWNFGLGSFDASEAGVFDSTVPVWSVLSAMALLGERLTPYQFAAGALVIGGVLFALSRPRRQEVRSNT